MSYSLTQIEDIIIKADKTLYKIGEIAYEDMFSENSEALDYERDRIFIYKKAAEWGDQFYVGYTPLDKIVERLASKLTIYDYGTLNPIYSNAVISSFVNIGNIVFSSRKITINGLTQDLSADRTWNVGDMTTAVYDTDADGTVDNAEKIAIIARNSTGSTLYKGTIVYLSGSTGNRPNAIKAQANAEATSSGTFGVIVSDISNNTDGYVAAIGTLHDLDTRSSATHPFTADTLLDGDILWLDPNNAGYVTRTKPVAPNHAVYVGIVARTHPSLGRIVYRIVNGFELDELHNVDARSPNNNDTIVYNSTTLLWGHKPITLDIISGFPTQSGNAGKFLTTDGSALSWGTVVSSNIYTADGTLTGNRTVTMGSYTLSFEKDIKVNGANLGTKAGTSVFFGYNSGASLTTGGSSIYFGYNSGNAVTTGSSNVLLGFFTGRVLDTGSSNTIIGTSAAYSLTSGSYNTFIGRQAGYLISTGYGNIIISSRSTGGSGITTGNYNTIIGNEVGGLSATLSNNIILADGQGNIRIRAFDTGNVTIGSNTDSGLAKLQVTGAIQQSSVTSSLLKVDSNGVLVAAISGTDYSVLPSQTGNSGKFLTTDGTNASWASVTTSPAGSDTQIQFNNSGAFGASANLVWDNTNVKLGVGTSIPRTLLNIAGVGNISDSTAILTIDGYSSTYGDYRGASTLTLTRSRSNTIGTLTTTLTGDNLASIIFQGVDSANNRQTTFYIQSVQNGAAGTGANSIKSDLAFYSSGRTSPTIPVLHLNNSGDIGIGTNSITPINNYVHLALNAQSGSFTEYRTNNANLFRVGSESNYAFLTTATTGMPIKFNTDGSVRMTLTAAGRLLLGTTTESTYQLDVQGTGRFTGDVKFGNATQGIITAPTSATIRFQGGSAPVSVELPYVIGAKDAAGFLLADNSYYVETRMFGWSGWGVGIKNGITKTDISGVPSAIFSISSTTQGFLPPRMTDAQLTAISTPAVGLQAYKTDATEGQYVNTSAGWKRFLTEADGATRFVQTFTATAGQTLFTSSNTLVSGYYDVFLNGVRISDFTATTNTITLTDACAVNDIVDIIGFQSNSLALGQAQNAAITLFNYYNFT